MKHVAIIIRVSGATPIAQAHLRTESQRVVRLQARVTCPKRRSATLIISIRIGIRAASLEVRVIRNTRGLARAGGVVGAAAATCRVTCTSSVT